VLAPEARNHRVAAPKSIRGWGPRAADEFVRVKLTQGVEALPDSGANMRVTRQRCQGGLLFGLNPSPHTQRVPQAFESQAVIAMWKIDLCWRAYSL
jgi:hypothetical protein